METPIFVHVDLQGHPRFVGRLWARSHKGKQSATFEYDANWLEYAARFSLEPALEVGPGPFYTLPSRALFGAMGDSAPDRWGRVLMQRSERMQARADGRNPHSLQEIDYLLNVNDESRQGALRFSRQEGGPFLSDSPQEIPPLLELPTLLAASEKLLAGEDGNEDDHSAIRLLLAPGSSLGGARPKASVRGPGGHLMIAKFPHKEDTYPEVVWEALALTLARKAGITVPTFRLKSMGKKNVLLLDRFDRHQRERIPYLSGMSMLGAKDGERRSYMELVDVLRQYSASPQEDMQELWRRIVFNVLISNVDDHLRNHGFLYRGVQGWRLSPAFDLNPVPRDVRPRILSTAITENDFTASLEIAWEVAPYFELSERQAGDIVRDVRAAVSTWRTETVRLGLKAAEISRMSSAFVHEDARDTMRS